MPNLPGADEPHVIPSGAFKIVTLAEKLQPTHVVAFIMEQDTSRDTDFSSKQVSIEVIEQRSWLNFFPDLDTNPATSAELAGFL